MIGYALTEVTLGVAVSEVSSVFTSGGDQITLGMVLSPGTEYVPAYSRWEWTPDSSILWDNGYFVRAD